MGRDNPELSGIKHHIRPDPIFHPSSKKLFPTFKRQAPVISPSVVSISPTPQLLQQAITANVLQAPLTVPILFILVQFTNRSATYAAACFANLISNQLRGYFTEVSYGRFIIAPASEGHGLINDGVVGWLTINQLHPNSAGANGAANQQLAANAISAADPYVDYAAYDLNGDGFIDSTELAIVIIPSGNYVFYVLRGEFRDILKKLITIDRQKKIIRIYVFLKMAFSFLNFQKFSMTFLAEEQLRIKKLYRP